MIRRIAGHDHIFANHLIDTSAKNFPPKKFFRFLRGLILAQTSGIRKLGLENSREVLGTP